MTVTKQIEAKVDAGKGTPEEVEAVRTFRAKMAQAQERQNRQLAEAVKKMKPATFEGHGTTKPTYKDAADWMNEPDEPDDPLIFGLIECGATCAIVGPAKAAKSYLALVLAVAVATGRDFVGFKSKRQHVYYANMEVSAKQCKKRLRAICKAEGITGEELRGWLHIDNLRGETATWKRCRQSAETCEAKVVILDPFYQIFKGKETDEGDCMQAVEEMKAFLKAGVSLFIVFHAPKGFSGDRQTVDMISGSSVLARYPENIVGIFSHATDKMARVIDASVLRDFTPPDPFSIKFENGTLVRAPEIDPQLKTSRGTWKPGKSQEERDAEKVKAHTATFEKLDAALVAYLNERGDDLPGSKELEAALRETAPKGEVEAFIKARRESGTIAQHAEMSWDANTKTWKRKGPKIGGKTLCSTPERIAQYHEKTSTFKLA